MVVPHRPAVLDRQDSLDIDVLSGGRLTLGVGAGWMREEFEAIDAPDFDARGTVTDEYVRAFVELWTRLRRVRRQACPILQYRFSSRSPCRNRIHRSGLEARAVRRCDEPRASVMRGIRSVPTRRIRSIA